MVGAEQEPAARAHRPVDEELDRAQLESRTVGAGLRGPADEFDLAALGVRGHAVDPDHELAVAVELAVDVGGAPGDAGVMDAGQARAEGQLLGREQPSPDVELGNGRDRAADQAHGPVDEDTRRPPFVVTDDLAVGRSLRIPW